MEIDDQAIFDWQVRNDRSSYQRYFIVTIDIFFNIYVYVYIYISPWFRYVPSIAGVTREEILNSWSKEKSVQCEEIRESCAHCEEHLTNKKARNKKYGSFITYFCDVCSVE